MRFSGYNEIGGSSFHVSDCQIWAEIHYLDSPTDYREYLPINRLQGSKPLENQLIMLDNKRPHWRAPARFMYVFMACLLWTLVLALILVLPLRH